MNSFSDRYFNKAYVVLCGCVFIVICLRAFFIPISHDEASTFFFYIQSDNYLPYRAHVYTNNHVLNSALANICYHLAGSHRFVLRIPNVLSFLLLSLAVFRFFKYFKFTSSKIILTSLFILTFNFLDFFELCRGYGLSVAFMVLGLSYLQDFLSDKNLKPLILFSICWQLALAANLTLVVLSAILFAFIFFFQYREKILLQKKTIMLQLLNLFLLAFWIKFSFYYKSKGVLDSGFGNNYWEVSFKSLMLFIFGTDALWLQVILFVLSITVFVFFMIKFLGESDRLAALFKPQYFYVTLLAVLILAFYLLKKLLHINYPEDRTGLFFYLFFVLSLAFFVDNLGKIGSLILVTPIVSASVIYFALAFNLESFTHYFYHVLPKEFYTYLENEHKKNQQLFTIGGHPNREMNYAFMNYRAGGFLNPMDDPREMHMNCDYNVALMAEKPFYNFFYEEVAYDLKWQRVLLKRKQPIKRSQISELRRSGIRCKGNAEFFEFLRFYDSTAATRNCIEADLEISFKKVNKPFKAFVVLQITDEQDKEICYKRALLNWLGDDLDGKSKRIKLTSKPLAGKYKNIVVYLWNIDKKECEMELVNLDIYNLDAPGINVVIPKNYYPYAKKIIKQELL